MLRSAVQKLAVFNLQLNMNHIKKTIDCLLALAIVAPGSSAMFGSAMIFAYQTPQDDSATMRMSTPMQY